jgi:hypothetical protein
LVKPDQKQLKGGTSSVFREILCIGQCSSQGILAGRVGTCALPADMHETFIEGKGLFLTLKISP